MSSGGGKIVIKALDWRPFVGEESAENLVGQPASEQPHAFGLVVSGGDSRVQIGVTFASHPHLGEAMRWSAALTCRVPPRLSRKLVLPLQTGIGAVPFQRANAARERNREAPAASPTTLAADSAPHPCSARNVGATPLTIRLISRSRSFTRSVS
jgi:hypothetical protein